MFPFKACWSRFLSFADNTLPQCLRAVFAPLVSNRWCRIYALMTTHRSSCTVTIFNMAIMFWKETYSWHCLLLSSSLHSSWNSISFSSCSFLSFSVSSSQRYCSLGEIPGDLGTHIISFFSSDGIGGNSLSFAILICAGLPSLGFAAFLSFFGSSFFGADIIIGLPLVVCTIFGAAISSLFSAFFSSASFISIGLGVCFTHVSSFGIAVVTCAGSFSFRTGSASFFLRIFDLLKLFRYIQCRCSFPFRRIHFLHRPICL